MEILVCLFNNLSLQGFEIVPKDDAAQKAEDDREKVDFVTAKS
jgi:hypothetical protein